MSTQVCTVLAGSVKIFQDWTGRYQEESWGMRSNDLVSLIDQVIGWIAECDQEDDQPFPFDDEDFRIDFADPGGNSALRAETPSNPRDQPCPTCKREDVLTPADVARGYQCDRCADRTERGCDY